MNQSNKPTSAKLSLKSKLPILFAVALLGLFILAILLRMGSSDGRGGRTSGIPFFSDDESAERTSANDSSGEFRPVPRLLAAKPLLEDWSEIPAEYLAAPAVIVAGKQDLKPLTYFWVMARLAWDEQLYGVSPDSVDHNKRAVGIVQTVDFYLTDFAGIPRVREWGAGADPKHYSPVGVMEGSRMPREPAIAKRKLLELLKADKLEGILKRLPSQHRIEGIEEVIRCRALAILGSLGDDPVVKHAMKEALYSEGPPQRKASAFAALVKQGDEAEARAWLLSQTDWGVLKHVLPGLTPAMRSFESTHDPRHAVTYGSFVSTDGRELDDALLYMANHAPDQGSLSSVAAALAGRVDNPRVQETVLHLLRTGSEETILPILRQRPALVEQEEYQAVLASLIQAKDARIQAYALESYAMIPSASIRDTVVTYLNHDNPRLAWVAVMGLESCGRYDPVGTITIIEDALRFRKHDARFKEEARLAILSLSKIADNYDEFRRENEEWIKSIQEQPK